MTQKTSNFSFSTEKDKYSVSSSIIISKVTKGLLAMRKRQKEGESRKGKIKNGREGR